MGRSKKGILLAALLLVAALIVFLAVRENNSPMAVKTQPQSVTVSYPEGAQFSVKVNHPKKVASYQWVMEDVAGNEFILQGLTAKTDTLVVPSTIRTPNDLEFYCIITDQDGNQIETERAILSEDNGEVNKPVLYICEYAVEPGESLDLSAVEVAPGVKLGKGTVAFDENATDITITDLYYDNSVISCDYSTGSNIGICFEFNEADKEEYNITFVGDNEIVNNYFDEDYNAAGIPLDFYITGLDENRPLFNLIGDGNLKITNGTFAVRAIGDLMVDIDITVRQSRKNYGDGIVAENLMIAEGSKLDLEVYGGGLYGSGNVYLKGADIRIEANAPHISVGIATKNIIQANRILMIDDCDIEVHTHADPAVCSHMAGLTALYGAAGLEAYDSDIVCTMEVDHNDEVYASFFNGIYASYASFENCKIDFKTDCRDIFSMFGVYTDEYTQFFHSDVSFDLKTSGQVYGIAPEGDFSSENSVVNVNVGSYDDHGTFETYGIMCNSFVMLSEDPSQTVRSHAENGIALGMNLNDRRDEPVSYRAGYQPQNLYLRNGEVCISPENSAFSLGSVEMEDIETYYLAIETVYDLNDTSKPAAEVIFGRAAQ